MPSSPVKSRPSSARVSAGQERSLIPVGMTTILPPAASHLRSLEQTLLAQLSRWGYQEILLPTFEYLDVLAPGVESDLIEKCYQFADRTTGRILVLRPDATAQIARTVAMGMLGPQRPLRLSYCTAVFRYEPEHAGRDREIFQVGAELIGRDDVDSDAEIIALMMECLQEAGLSSFTVSVGHVGFFRALLAESGMSEEGQKRAEHAAARKDLPRLEEVLQQEGVARSTAKSILEAPGLYGREEVLERGRRLAGRNRALTAPLDRLARVYDLLASTGKGKQLLLDLGEFRGFDYYDGIVFDVFAHGIGVELGGGGRYDHLIGRFGAPTPSTGFAIDINRLFRVGEGRARRRQPDDLDYLVCAGPRGARQAQRLVQTLRDRGARVMAGSSIDGSPHAVDAAIEQGRARRASAVVMVGASGTASGEVVIIEGLEDGAARRQHFRGGDSSHPLIRTVKLAPWLRERMANLQDGGQ